MRHVLKFKKRLVIIALAILLTFVLLFVLLGDKKKSEDKKGDTDKQIDKVEIFLKEDESEGGLEEQKPEEDVETKVEQQFPFVDSEPDVNKQPAEDTLDEGNSLASGSNQGSGDITDKGENDNDNVQGDLENNTSEGTSQKFTQFF